MDSDTPRTQQAGAPAPAKDDILHFQELLDAIKVTFPHCDYAGTWLDLSALLSLLRLSHINGEDQNATWGKGRPERLAKFYAALEHEVEKVKKYARRPHVQDLTCFHRHFRVTAIGLIKAWRSEHALDTDALSKSIPRV